MSGHENKFYLTWSMVGRWTAKALIVALVVLMTFNAGRWKEYTAFKLFCFN